MKNQVSFYFIAVFGISSLTILRRSKPGVLSWPYDSSYNLNLESASEHTLTYLILGKLIGLFIQE